MDFIKLFSGCFMTKGAKRSIIVDAQRDRYYYIPNEMFALFDDNMSFCINDYSNADTEETINLYVKFLIDNELGFICSPEELERFPQMNMAYEDNSIISNAVIDLYHNGDIINDEIVPYLTDKLNTRTIEFRLLHLSSTEVLKMLLDRIVGYDLTSISLVIHLSEANTVSTNEYINVVKQFGKIYRTCIYNADKNDLVYRGNSKWGAIFLIASPFSNSLCGCVGKEYFTLNQDHFLEALNYNTCLNKKLFIDVHGNIKNCPSSANEFGNANNRSLLEIISSADFTAVWHISKDKVETCNVCEYRNICTDCRVYTTGDSYSKPAKCGYDPYSCTWHSLPV